MPNFGLVFGCTVLVHAVYSSYEWVSMHKFLDITAPRRVSRDVVIELVIALVIIVFSTVTTIAAQLKPLKNSDLNRARTVAGVEPFAYLETRPNFQDLVGKRKAYLDWKRTEQAFIREDAEKL